MGRVLGLSGNETKFGFLGNLIGKTWNFEFVAVSKMRKLGLRMANAILLSEWVHGVVLS